MKCGFPVRSWIVDHPRRNLHAKLEDKGLVGLGYYELGFRHITNSRRPITKVEDIAGLKLRVIPNPINVDWVTALVALDTTELSQGVVEDTLGAILKFQDDIAQVRGKQVNELLKKAAAV